MVTIKVKLNMKFCNSMLSIYAVTQRYGESTNEFLQKITNTIIGGATIIQLREKNILESEFINLAKQVKEICDKYGVGLIINDNVNVAIAVNALGVHIGQNDQNLQDVKKILPKNMIVGLSVQTTNQAIQGELLGANYLGVGAIFETNTKEDAADVSLQTLQEICLNTTLGVVAIGGINPTNIEKLKATNIDGIAVVSHIFNNDINEVENKTKQIKKL